MNAAYYYYNEDGETGGDDWLISSPIHLEKGKSYRLRFKLQAYDSSYPEKVAVYLGTDTSIEGQTVQLGDYLVEEFTLTEHKVVLPQNLETGNYYISFHCYSEPNMFTLYLTDVTLEEVNEGSISGIVKTMTCNRPPTSRVPTPSRSWKAATTPSASTRRVTAMPNRPISP